MLCLQFAEPLDPKEAKHAYESQGFFGRIPVCLAYESVGFKGSIPVNPRDLKDLKDSLDLLEAEHAWTRVIIAITKFKLVHRNFRVIESLIQICYNNILLNFINLVFQAFKSFRCYFIKICDLYL